MNDHENPNSFSDDDRELIRTLHESKIINYDEVGKVIARVTPELFSRKIKPGNYFISVYTKFIHVYEIPSLASLASLQDLRAASRDLRE